MASKDQVIALNREHPDWNSTDIAAALGCEPAYVRATAVRCGLALAKRHGGGGGLLKARCEVLADALRALIAAVEAGEDAAAADTAVRQAELALGFYEGKEARHD